MTTEEILIIGVAGYLLLRPQPQAAPPPTGQGVNVGGLLQQAGSWLSNALKGSGSGDAGDGMAQGHPTGAADPDASEGEGWSDPWSDASADSVTFA